MLPEKTITLTIDTLVHGGRGLGRHAGKAVFVPGTIPGERVLCRVEREKRSYAEAELVEILEASPLRRSPPCPYFGTCGGCQWQHLPYSEQVSWKTAIFNDQMVRSGVAEPGSIGTLQPAPTEFHYRNRAQFKCRMTDGGLAIGFYRRGSHFVVDVERCLLLRDPLQHCLSLLREILPSLPGADCIPQVDVSCSDTDAMQVVVHRLPQAPPELEALLTWTARRQGFGLSVQAGRKTTLRTLIGETEQVLNLDDSIELHIGPGGFSQVNSAQNAVLVGEVARLADLRGTERVLDLFCGAGNFSLPLARRATTVDGVEAFSPAIADARRNARRNRITNATFHAESATDGLARLWDDQGFDLVVLDPPRSGCYPVVKTLQRLRPQRIIYVSCEPATLARDLQPLVHHGYRLVASRPFDFFPQTAHIESVSLLEQIE